MSELHIIPKPEHMKRRFGVFAFDMQTTIFAPREYLSVADHLAQALTRAIGGDFNLKQSKQRSRPVDAIFLVHDEKRSDLGDEGYTLSIKPNNIIIRSFRPAGAFYACQTLCQLLPLPTGIQRDPRKLCMVQQVEIEDRPRFPWRGFMLDSVRHFQDKEFIKHLIDTLAFYKINRLHWHLCDTQGWRIEIEKYPELTRTANGQKYDYYSKSDIREIIDYAAARHIQVYPEVEMPGHSEWALGIFQDLRCENAEPPFYEYCLGTEKTGQFLKTVLTEVLDLFPNAIIHLGGDEANADHWRKCPKCQACIKANGLENELMLQKWFMQKMTDFVHAQGRETLAWAERQDLGWPAGQIVHGWHAGESDHAVAHGLKTVNSNHEHVYFDYPSALDDPIKNDWMPELSLQKVYAFDPVPAGASPEQASLVLGSEACLWTENIPQNKVHEKTFPRLLAFSESVWSPAESRDWSNFQERVSTHYQWLDAMGVSYFRSVK